MFLENKQAPSELPEELLETAVPLLLEWYRNNARPLPWREGRNPYTIWISEIMLQQTRIAAVIPYYTRFLRELPTVEALAACPTDRLLKLWEGLGYYSRARNLQKAAQLVVKEYGGRLPTSSAELSRLPGIGPYTAGAIASMAFGEPVPAIDGNVLRVLARLLLWEEDVTGEEVCRRAAGILKQVFPTGEGAYALNPALMELGETVCVPGESVSCHLCPLSELCRAKECGRSGELPHRGKKPPRRVEKLLVLWVAEGERLLLVKRSGKGVLSGLWGPVTLPLAEEQEMPTGDALPPEAEQWLSEAGLKKEAWEYEGASGHLFTHIEWKMENYRVRVADREDIPGGIWVTREETEENYSVPSAFRKKKKGTGKR